MTKDEFVKNFIKEQIKRKKIRIFEEENAYQDFLKAKRKRLKKWS